MKIKRDCPLPRAEFAHINTVKIYCTSIKIKRDCAILSADFAFKNYLCAILCVYTRGGQAQWLLAPSGRAFLPLPHAIF